ncbi:FAD-dependent monooxygenase [Labrenzia sp. CE80]|uniref:FAD-dependent monooxygenase n=1 Tax=Labrenzia sp. CE80 TaxID=1788986 RepID=UPI00129A5DC3|nr:FAD-dependent monooxygenase [Labrenzia sp. CE80]
MNAPLVIAGAGIGGLTAAVALSRAGHRVLVLERASALSEVGAGLQLSPNACKCLDKIGVLEAVRKTASAPEAIRIRSARSGKALAHIPLGSEASARYGAPYLLSHRADLQKALYDKARSLPSVEVRFGHSFIGSHVDEAGNLSVTFQADDGRNLTLQAKALVGADGVWSRVRETLREHATAKFSGRTAYRATLRADQVDPGLLRDTGLWLGKDAHIVHYPIRQQSAFNIVVLVAEDWNEQDWSAPADRISLLKRFAQWAPDARRLLETPDSWLKWALCGVPATGPWAQGKTVLIGDAAHAMLPFAAQGAAMAIEDALVLASVLTPETTDIADALCRFERQRRERVRKVQKTAEENGRIYHMSGPLALGRDTVLRMSSPESLSARMDWIYGWTPPS